MSEKKHTCKDCKYYKPIDETKGVCFGHEIPVDTPAEQCPAKAFEPKKELKQNKERVEYNHIVCFCSLSFLFLAILTCIL